MRAKKADKTPAPEQRLTLSDVLETLASRGVISAAQQTQLERSLSADDDRHPIIRIAEQGLQSTSSPAIPLTIENLTRQLAAAYGMEYARIDPLKIDVGKITQVVSQAYATRFQILPLAASEEEVTIAVGEPFVREWEPELGRALKRRIKRVLANPREIRRYLSEFYGVSRSILGAAADKSAKPESKVANFEQLTELGRVGEPDANDQHIVHLVDWLLQFAFDQRASDIHIEPRREQSNVRFRIDGVLHLVHQVPTPVIAAITSRLKSLGRMDVTDKRRPQDGRVRTKAPSGREVELRLSTMPTTFGEKLVMRIFDPEILARPLSDLGFAAHDVERWNSMVTQPHGVMLVTGPTGSGKTTTLYSALRLLARPEINVCTIEDPIEMVEPVFNQMQVQPGISLDFAAGVRTLLRQDPDIIMVGEIRDKETADVAIQAALTGHLVLSTLHTNDAPAAITRLLDIGVQPYLIGATLLGVLAQRLVRTLCSHCKVPGTLDADAWRGLLAPQRQPVPHGAQRPVGCDECRHTGYRGRVGLYEMLTVSETLRALIKPGAQGHELRAAALKTGMVPLRMSGAMKIAAGLTTLEEVLSVVPQEASTEGAVQPRG